MVSSVSCQYAESKSSCPNCLENKYPHLDNQFRFKEPTKKPSLEELDFSLVGKGEKGKNCGEYVKTAFCEVCGKVHYVKHSCRRKACPNCYDKWKNEEKTKARARLLSYEAKEHNPGKRLFHIQVSRKNNEQYRTKMEVDEYIKDGYEYAKEKGVRGGSMVFHPYRTTEEAKNLSRGIMGKWQFVRERDNIVRNLALWSNPNYDSVVVRENESWEDFARYSPHLHLIAYVDHLEEPKKGEEWGYKNISYSSGYGNLKVSDDGISYERAIAEGKKGYKYSSEELERLKEAKEEIEDNLEDVVNYLLTHTIYLKGDETKHSLTWFGSCSYNKFGTTLEEENALEGLGSSFDLSDYKCVDCGGKLLDFWSNIREYYGNVDWLNSIPDENEVELENQMLGFPPPDGSEKYVLEVG